MNRLVLAGGLVLDGTGTPGYIADVTIQEDRIVSVTPVSDFHPGAIVQDISHLAIAPGFIDSHSHADNAPFLSEADQSKVLQGVTTEVVGNCGLSLAPRSSANRDLLDGYLQRFFPVLDWKGDTFGDFLRRADDAGYLVNYAPLVGHGTLRVTAMGFEDRDPTSTQLSRLRALVEEALDAGAIGLSTGLVYPPGRFAQTPELIELARCLHGRPALYASHIRSEGRGRMAAVREAISIGREADVRVQISHHKAMGRNHWGQVSDSLAEVRAARTAGVDVRFDVYPYTASSTTLASCLPPELAGLDNDALMTELRKPEVVDRLRHDLANEDWDNHVHQCGGFSGILITSTHDRQFESQTLEDVASSLKTDGTGALVNVLLAEHLRATMVCFAMSESDVETALSDDLTSIGSDGLAPGMPGTVHPRMWGTFPRVLGRYVREKGILSLEEAIRRMTDLPATTFRLPNRGRIEAGYMADLVTFDPQLVIDRATYLDSRLPPSGINDVIINGVKVVADGRFRGMRAGRRLRAT